MVQGNRTRKAIPLDEADIYYDCFKSFFKPAYEEGALSYDLSKELH